MFPRLYLWIFVRRWSFLGRRLESLILGFGLWCGGVGRR